MKKVLITGPANCGKSDIVERARIGAVDLDKRLLNPNSDVVEYKFNIIAALFHGPANVFVGDCPEEQTLISLAKEHGLVVIGLCCANDELFNNCDIYITDADSCVNLLNNFLK